MKDFKEVFTLLEKIDPQYKNYMNIKREVNEAMKSSFMFNELDNVNNPVEYCREHIGEEIGCGSSRMVFQLEDNMVLKLAINYKGFAQNKAEFGEYGKNLPLLPYIYAHSANFLWLVSEYVLPVSSFDFQNILGDRFIGFANNILEIYSQKRSANIGQRATKIINNDPTGTYKRIYDYIIKCDAPVGDMLSLENWGMTQRSGKPTFVLLDAGFTKETMKLYGFEPSPSINN